MDSNQQLPPTSGVDLPVLAPTADVPAPSESAVPVPAAANVPQGGGVPGGKQSPDSPEVAEDVDLIEKEWVAKAKMIVARTANDPSQQSKELGKFKADYLKTRFNKDIKAGD